jgi:hypothetical protein
VKRTGRKALLAVIAACPLVLCGAGTARAADPSFGVGLGYFQPVGDWAQHRFAPGVDQFGGGIAFAADFEWRLVRQLGLAVNGSYVRLSAGEWEDYAGAQGDAVDVSVQMATFGILVKPYLWSGHGRALKVILGLNVFVPDGKETFEGLTYEYDFLQLKAGYILGLEWAYPVSGAADLALCASYMFAPNAVEYADGLSYTLGGAELTAGARFHF